GSGYGPACRAVSCAPPPTAAASDSTPARPPVLKLTTRAPEVLRKSLREVPAGPLSGARSKEPDFGGTRSEEPEARALGGAGSAGPAPGRLPSTSSTSFGTRVKSVIGRPPRRHRAHPPHRLDPHSRRLSRRA